MIRPDPVHGAALYEHAASLRRVAEELDAVVDGTVALAAEIAASWADPTGRGWAQRMDLVGRELGRQAGVAVDLVRMVTALADRAGEPGPPTGPEATGRTVAESGAAVSTGVGTPFTERDRAGSGTRGDPHGGTGDASGPSWSLPGPRLGGTDGGRATERRGVVVPALPDQPGG